MGEGWSLEERSDHYSILGVKRNATVDEIRHAYRAKAKDIHPDINPSHTAKEEFQRLHSAYEILTNIKKRAQYDAFLACTENHKYSTSSHEHHAKVEPARCDSCGSVSAQPRYIILWTVVSLLIISVRKPVQGVFCYSCAAKKAFICNIITWLFGWWGLPWGPIWSLQYLASNFNLGEKPRPVNAELLARQAVAFAQASLFHFAHSAAKQSAHFADSADLRDFLSQFQESLPGPKVDRASLRDPWVGFVGTWRYAQLYPIIGVLVTIAVVFYSSDNKHHIYVQHSPALVSHTTDPDTPAIPFAHKPTLGTDYVQREDKKKWHVTAENLNLRAGPNPKQPPVGSPLPRFTSFEITEDSDADWARIRTEDGREGFVFKKFIGPGSGEEERRRFCTQNSGSPPSNGEVLSQTKTGPHTIRVTNGLGEDAVVKMKSGRSTIISMYVRASGVAQVATVPNGQYSIEFATGNMYSRGCGRFINVTATQRFVDTENFAETSYGSFIYSSRLDLTLHKVPGGNTTATSIPDEDFWD